MKILITGGNGQLGQELQHLLDERGIAYDAADVDVSDITDEAKVDTYFAKNRPEVVYHCAAYTAVDKAEGEGKKVNELVNAVGSEIMAKACQKYDALMVYVSTDYVFDGSRTEGEYIPDDPKGLFKSITFDNGKEFDKWKDITLINMIAIPTLLM